MMIYCLLEMACAVEGVFKHVQKNFQLLPVDFTLYLGLNITMSDNEIHLSQRDFILKILDNENYRRVMEHDVTNMKEKPTPITEVLHAPVWLVEGAVYPEGEVMLEDEKAAVYRSMVGACLYLNWARPDVKVAVTQLARHMARPTEKTWTALKRLLCYLKGTVEWGLSMPRSTCVDAYELTMYVDASHAAQVSRTSTKSVSGYVIFLNEAVISFHSGKQSLTSVSSTESEVLALCDGVLCLRGVASIVDDYLSVHGGAITKTTIHCDNTSAIILCQDRNNCTAKNRHFAIRQSICREYLEGGANRKIEYIDTLEQVGDFFTKPLPRDAFNKHRALIVKRPSAV